MAGSNPANHHSERNWSRSPIHQSLPSSPRVMSSCVITLCSSSLFWIARCPPRLVQVWEASDQLSLSSLKYQQVKGSLVKWMHSLSAWPENNNWSQSLRWICHYLCCSMYRHDCIRIYAVKVIYFFSNFITNLRLWLRNIVNQINDPILKTEAKQTNQ